MAYAYNGTNTFEGAAVTDFSTVAALYMEQVQICLLYTSIGSEDIRVWISQSTSTDDDDDDLSLIHI